MLSDQAVVRRKSGIVTPVSALAHHDRTMGRQKFLRLLRHRAFARDLGLAAQFTCLQCQKPLQLKRADAAIVEAETAIDPKRDAFLLVCGCTTWTVR